MSQAKFKDNLEITLHYIILFSGFASHVKILSIFLTYVKYWKDMIGFLKEIKLWVVSFDGIVKLKR